MTDSVNESVIFYIHFFNHDTKTLYSTKQAIKQNNFRTG